MRKSKNSGKEGCGSTGLWGVHMHESTHFNVAVVLMVRVEGAAAAAGAGAGAEGGGSGGSAGMVVMTVLSAM